MPSLLSDKYITFNVSDDYVFVTDDGRTYSVSFIEQPFFGDDDYEYASITYEVFLNLEKAPPVYSSDIKIGITVTAIIQDFIEKDPLRVVFFTCDTADGRQASRFRKFSFWFSEFQDGKYGRYDERIFSPLSQKEFLIMMLVRTDNPNRADIIRSYFDLADQLRSRK